MIQVRKATLEDAKVIAPIKALAMLDILYYFIGQENLQEAVLFLQRLIATERNQYSYENIIVAHHGDEILGQACLYPGENLATLKESVSKLLWDQYKRKIEDDEETQEGEIYLDSIAVSPNAQGQGIGKILLSHILEYYVEKNRKTVGLLVDKTNPKAKSLYLNVGFQIVGQKQIFGHEMEHLQYAPRH